MSERRELDLTSLHLERGSHTPDHTFCVMEAVAYMAGETWTDHPKCVHPIISSYCRVLNDNLPDNERQRLVPYIEKLLGTDAIPTDKLRFVFANRAVRVFLPFALDACGLKEDASKLRSLVIIDSESAASAAWSAAWSAESAARSAAWSAANAARSAANAANAATSAASAAWSAAWSAESAARSAAWSAANAAWDEAFKLLDDVLALKP